MGYSPHSRIRLRAIVGLLLCCFASLVGAIAASAETVAFDTGDASDVVVGTDIGLLNNLQNFGQSFTAGTEGDLTSVEARIDRAVFGYGSPAFWPDYPVTWQPLTLTLLAFDEQGGVDRTPLATATVDADDVPWASSAVTPAATEFVFGNPARLEAGKRYLLLFTSETPYTFYNGPDSPGYEIWGENRWQTGDGGAYIQNRFNDFFGLGPFPYINLAVVGYYGVRDRTRPTVSCGNAPPGWQGSNASVACTAEDDVGLANPDDAAFSLSTSVASGDETANASTGSRQVCDTSNNCTTAGPITGIKVDRKAPSIAITSPSGGDQYLIGSSHAAAFDCADGGSLVATCTGAVANGAPVDTSTVGSHTFSVNATDNVGNAAPTASADYSVIWPWTGFAGPVNTNDSNGNSVLNSVSAGRAIPVKFSLGGNRGLNILAAGSPSSGSVACSATASTDPVEQTVTAGASSLSYDSTSGQYVYVWKTDKAWAGSCRQLSVRLIDGTTHKASFQFTK